MPIHPPHQHLPSRHRAAVCARTAAAMPVCGVAPAPIPTTDAAADAPAGAIIITTTTKG